jgi:aminoglycoside phosphotransferase
VSGPAASTHDVTVLGDRVVKRFRSDGRGEYRREWRALHLLARHAPGLAPEPLDGDPRTAVITMTRLPGAPLGAEPLEPRQVDALGAALDRLHHAVPADTVAACDPVIGHPAAFVPRVTAALAGHAGPTDDPTVTTACEAARQWLASAEARALCGPGDLRPVFGRDDHNPPNFLWDGTRARLVDFEDSGCSDRPSELACLVEHLGARCTPDRVWEDMLGRVGLDAAERARLRAARRLHAAFWLAVLLPGRSGARRNPPGTLHRQAGRLLGLL